MTEITTYGPTEGTLFCSWQKFDKKNYLNYCNPTMSIGIPIPGWNFAFNQEENFNAYEIIVYGDYIGKGYLGTVSDTKFKELEIEGKKVSAFETGDYIAKIDGSLYFLYRIDRQVKLNGFRIELDEIDLRIIELLNKPSVTIFYNDSLYSFIETTENFSEVELRTFLSKKMEAHKIPRTFIKIEKYPRNMNAKIDYSKLSNLINETRSQKST